MIKQVFTIDDYCWFVKVFYIVDTFPKEEVYESLIDLGCDEDEAINTVDSLEEEGLNVGAIYSNIHRRASLIVIGKADSVDEFYNTFDHEKGHLAMHICIADDIDPFSEKYQYLVGDIAKSMFSAAKELFCEKCRERYMERQ